MTFMRHFHRNAWCCACEDQTPHDEDGKGLCVVCQKELDKWISDFAAKQRRLGPEFEKVLSDNLWELYVS